MMQHRFLTLITAAVLGTPAIGQQHFTLSGRIDGLQPGDTLRFERVIHPRWELEPAFDIIVKKAGTFRYRGTQEHDQHYVFTYHPKTGEARRCDRQGMQLILTDGDRLQLHGTANQIYYSTLTGGLYDDPLLAESLRLDDSLGMIRGNYAYEAHAAFARKDTAAGRKYEQLFNNFSYTNTSDPGFKRSAEADKAYAEAHPDGTLYLLLDKLPEITYEPLDQSRATYESYSPELKESYYGRLFDQLLRRMEQLANGQPAPDFTVISTTGQKLTKADFRGRHLLIYHWGLCPGSLYIDPLVRELHDKYHAQGLDVLGVTESIATIRQVHDKLPTGKKVSMPGVDDMRTTLAGMLQHPWTEVEVETDHPDNKSLMESFFFTGWPFFILIGPDGTIQARGFFDAFEAAQAVLENQYGNTSAQ